jgi:predicted pyridoxine 5'-phosphate oxidase superfamily flavin-nucleotide-binding protein
MLTQEMKDAIARTELFPLASSSRTGIPNVVPVKWLHVAADDVLWITDNFLHKTLANLLENPEAALYVWSPEPKLCVQIKGSVEVRTEGAEYEAMKARVRRQKPDLPAKSLVVLRIREIHDCLPGPASRPAG